MRNKNAEQKLRNKNCGTKNGGDHWTLGAGDLKCKCKKVSGTKMWNKNWWGLLDIGCWGPQVEVQKGQLNKNAEQKLVGTLLHLYLGSPLPNVQWSPPIFIPLFLFRIFVLLTFLHLHLRSPTPNVQESPPIFVHFFCSAVFVPHFCSADLFALVLRVPITQCPMVPTNFYSALFCSAVFVPHFCSADLFALVLRVPITQCPMVPTNFYSTVFVPLFLFCIFVLLTFLHLHLRSPTPNVQWSPPIFVPQFLFRIFVPLTFLHLYLGSPLPSVQWSPPIFISAFLFCIFVPLTFLHLHLLVPNTQCPT